MIFFSNGSQNLKILVTSFGDVTKPATLLLHISDSHIFNTPTRLHGHQKESYKNLNVFVKVFGL